MNKYTAPVTEQQLVYLHMFTSRTFGYDCKFARDLEQVLRDRHIKKVTRREQKNG